MWRSLFFSAAAGKKSPDLIHWTPRQVFLTNFACLSFLNSKNCYFPECLSLTFPYETKPAIKRAGKKMFLKSNQYD